MTDADGLQMILVGIDGSASSIDAFRWVCVGVLGSAASRDLLEPWPVLRDYVVRGEARPAHAAAVTGAV
jgi:hypothetical protein